MKDLIAKLQLDANCALGAIWLHIEAREKHVAELEAELAKLRAGAQVVAEPVVQAWGHITPRDFVEVATAIMEQHGLMEDLTYAKTEKLCEDMEASFKKLPHPVQAPVSEVPDNTHKFITSTSLIDLRGDLAVAAALGESIILSPESMKAILHAMRTGYPLPAALVQETKP